ncbi:unnamed protein product [Didymodactylos carnosus]|uniref:BHLH domain-containing protein n=1 Tax=Didymodactylos carnosus TaxID=1234261 RepID=A0A814HXV2_9BILA|nr:unnamed protein product [Didymodactylos carnosus]CAF1276632.1 unnamed protein product [Didymodactylos carnosus]CAF3786208.1 unnamed protein product [Didymodactylos carnosus]CAF4081694.1 unnamed protein product [Didymodactylos carnosus]
MSTINMESEAQYEQQSVSHKKSRRGRKRIQDPSLVIQMKRNRRCRANDRERIRMRSLNGALEHLREILPIDDTDDKLTKIETLKMASDYICLLTNILYNTNISPNSSRLQLSSPLSSTSSSSNTPCPYLSIPFSTSYNYYPSEQTFFKSEPVDFTSSSYFQQTNNYHQQYWPQLFQNSTQTNL